ncbi:sensor histidine kinase [Sphingomonas sp. YR710]|uniref:sensor histidine kinase n=1 Tax=Sphingomonas sp. YR710 TaxID=1882773 RepID=UPI0015A0C973|nr:sensor histidine kinase [Sphingomonas sp. YR710]
MAVIAASVTPLLLLDDALVIIAASRSFGSAFDFDVEGIRGKPLGALGSDAWGADHLRLMLTAVQVGGDPLRNHEISLTPRGKPTQRLRLDAELLSDVGQKGDDLILLTITDLTGIRAQETEEKISHQDKDVQLQELQHRIANSLQVIASMLMQGARRTTSAEARCQIEEAHHRVLAVAAVQNHLAMARTGNVRLRAYLTTLCRNITASMIADPAQLSLEVQVDESIADADDAMSIGLIATELVINALKHAFPDHHPGKITLSYRTTAGGWTLMVSDNGVGMNGAAMRAVAPLAPPGLGTVIVEALARKLGAHVMIAFGGPGTTVSISR